jgi:hypothetical protein
MRSERSKTERGRFVSVVILDWNTMLPLLILNRGDQREVRQREAARGLARPS